MTLISTLWALAPGDRSPPADERSLIQRALDDDASALRSLYHLHAPAIRRFLRGLLGCPVSADDATQETFVRAFRRLDGAQLEGRLAPWLFGIAKNVALEHRKRRRRDGAVPDGWQPQGQHEGATPESALLGAELARTLEGALARLSEERRAALLLRVDHGLPYEEIALVMGWSLAKAKVEVHRARQVLRACMDDDGGAP